MGCEVKIIEDSVNPYNGIRLTTFQLRYWRAIHAEVMTHRVFCAAFDSVLEFDLPGGMRKKNRPRTRRVYYMKIEDFVKKWHNGAKKHIPPRRNNLNINLIDDDKVYTAKELSEILGYAFPSTIRTYCRKKRISVENPNKTRSEDYLILGKKYKEFFNNPLLRTYDIKERLRKMQIRQYDEENKTFTVSNVVDCCYSGKKEVFSVIAEEFNFSGSKDHLLLTENGWKRIEEIIPGEDKILVKKFGKNEEDFLDPNRLKNIDGVYTCKFARDIKPSIFKNQNNRCLDCGLGVDDGVVGFDVHHVIPVSIDKSKAFDVDNIVVLCKECHKKRHKKRMWEVEPWGLIPKYVLVDKIVSRGVQDTYDLEIAGNFPNYIANGVVVHNSRNASSSRAIPVKKIIKQVWNDPAGPTFWGKNQAGMQAYEELDGWSRIIVQNLWEFASKCACTMAFIMNLFKPHKQILNRILEPWQYISVIITATEWDNFFELRAHPAAQPEIQVLARKMKDALEMSQPISRKCHLPYISDEERKSFDIDVLMKLSTARCARVSYLTHDGKTPSFGKDIELHDRLVGSVPIHASPTEHQAVAVNDIKFHKNFRGWSMYRETLEKSLEDKNGSR